MKGMIIVTAPHSFCLAGVEQRHCDRVAGIAAESLYSKLPQPSRLCLGDTLRSVMDLNRPVARNTTYRKQLSKLMNRDEVVILDVHSFLDDDLGPQPLIIIDNEPQHPDSTARRLRSYLMFRGLDVGYLVGNEDNDIQLEALRKDCSVVLLEFNERLTPRVIDHITQLIADWVQAE